MQPALLEHEAGGDSGSRYWNDGGYAPVLAMGAAVTDPEYP